MGFGDFFDPIVDLGLTFTGGADDLLTGGKVGDLLEGGFSTVEGKFGAAAGLATGSPIAGLTGLTVGGGFGQFNQRQRRKAAQKQVEAIQQSRKEASVNQNKLIEKSFRSRASSRGQGGSGNLAPGQQGASQQGTSLLSPQASVPSLFEGN